MAFWDEKCRWCKYVGISNYKNISGAKKIVGMWDIRRNKSYYLQKLLEGKSVSSLSAKLYPTTKND
jgi:hypothetical protein